MNLSCNEESDSGFHQNVCWSSYDRPRNVGNAALIAMALLVVVLARPAILASRSAADAAQPSIGHQEVYDALAASPDGKVYVLVLLSHRLGPQEADPAARRSAVWAQQQAVLDALPPADFELIHRPELTAALSGQINETGPAKLATHPLVVDIAADVMNDACLGNASPDCDADELIVKFRDDVRARAIADQSLAAPDPGELRAVVDVAGQFGLRFAKLINLADDRLKWMEQRAAAATGTAQPDLAGIMIATVGNPSTQRMLAAGEALQQLEQVEYAYLEVLAVPPPTPDYFGQQDYWGANIIQPGGILNWGLDFEYAWSQGATGADRLQLKRRTRRL